jgi:hypothetical protein
MKHSHHRHGGSLRARGTLIRVLYQRELDAPFAWSNTGISPLNCLQAFWEATTSSDGDSGLTTMPLGAPG